MRFFRCVLLVGWLLTFGAAVGVAVLAFFALPQLGLVLLVVAVAYRGRQFVRDRWTYGTARWAGFKDLLHAGMLTSNGILLGRVVGPKLPAAGWLLATAPWWASGFVCRLFLRAIRGRSDVWVRTSGKAPHLCVVAPTGAGKGQAVLVPTLKTYAGSTVVCDPKGELYRLTAAHRAAMGHRIVVCDPFRVCTTTPDTLNVLDGIYADSPLALAEAQAVAEAVVIKTLEERDPHWNESSETHVWCITAWVVLEAPPEIRNLQTVAQILADPDRLKAAIELIRESDNELLARLGSQLAHYVDREASSVLTTTNRHLRFLSTPAVVESTTASTFDPLRLRQERMTVYLILPTEYLRTQSPLLRLWLTALLRACIRGGATESGKVLFLLDEAAALGHMACIEDAVTQLRGYGVRLVFFYQSIGQLEKCFPKGGAQTFLANMDRLYFAVNDYATAERVSAELGDATVPVLTTSGGTNQSTTTDFHGHQSTQRGSNDNWSLAHAGRKLLQPAEILRLDERIGIVFCAGVRPFLTRLVRAYEPEFKSFLKGGV
jgi:type IV secretion system protein VirD4